MGRLLSVALFILLWLFPTVLRAEGPVYAIRGIELGQPQESARARLRADNPHHENRQDPAHPELERDLASSLWNLQACTPSRGTVTRAACTRTEIRYSHPEAGARVMAISFTQTLKPTVSAAEIKSRLVAAYGPPKSDDRLQRGLFRNLYGRVLVWEGEGDRRLEAKLFFFDGAETRTDALTLRAEDGALTAETQALLGGAQSTGPEGSQLTF